MRTIPTRDDFIEYIMKTLGHPMITVNLTEDQVNYRIDDALYKFFEFHSDGSWHAYMLHKLDQEEETSGRIKLPETVLSVMKVYPSDGMFQELRQSNGNNLVVTSFMQNMGSSIFGGIGGLGNYAHGGYFPSNFSGGGSGVMGFGALPNYMYTTNYLNTIQGMVSGEHDFQYIKHGNILVISDKSVGVKADGYILIECFLEVDEQHHPVWDSIWLRNYAVALCKKQWGMNLIKFGNTQLANGTTINGQEILAEGNKEIDQLEEELKTLWSPPLGIMVG